jgi:hypothetical protein
LNKFILSREIRKRRAGGKHIRSNLFNVRFCSYLINKSINFMLFLKEHFETVGEEKNVFRWLLKKYESRVVNIKVERTLQIKISAFKKTKNKI